MPIVKQRVSRDLSKTPAKARGADVFATSNIKSVLGMMRNANSLV